MGRFNSHGFLILGALLAAASIAACSDSLLGTETRTYNSTDDGGAGALVVGSPARGEALFRALEVDLVTSCGGGSGACHLSGAFPGNPPAFLKPPDAYKSIKSTQGMVVADVSSSAILVKGSHAGPALPDALKPRIIEWLTAEAQLLETQRPVSPAFAPVIGSDNDLDVSALGTGVRGVHLKFMATLAGSVLSFSNVRLAAPPGQAVHILHLSLARVPADLNQPETTDPVDNFSNLDLVVAPGAETTLPPGAALFTGWKWQAGDKLRVQMSKLEPGVLQEAAVVAMCQNPIAFGTAVVPALQTCLSCHAGGGNAVGAMDLSGLQATPQDFATACVRVMSKVDKNAPGDSLIVKKNDGRLSHSGMKPADNGAALKAAIVSAVQNNVF